MHFHDNALLFLTDVKSELDNLSKTMKNFEARVGFAKDLETISSVCCITLSLISYSIKHKWGQMYWLCLFFRVKGTMLTSERRSETMTLLSPKVSLSAFPLPWFYLCIGLTRKQRKLLTQIQADTQVSFMTTGRQRVAHTPNSKPKQDAIFDLKEEEENDEEGGDGGSRKSVLTEEELWARLDELEKLEELQDEQDRYTISSMWLFLINFDLVRNWNESYNVFSFSLSRLSDNADVNGEDTSSSSSEEEKEGDAAPPVNGLSLKPNWSSLPRSKEPPNVDRKDEEEDDKEDDEGDCLPTIYFSHTVEPKKVRMIRCCIFCSCCLLSVLLTLSLPFLISLSPCASGEDKHRKKHHIEVQWKERAERTLEEEKEKWSQ